MPRRFTLYYFVCVIGAALTQLLVVHAIYPGPYPTIGASGGIFGMLLFYGMAFPHRRLLLLFPPIPMPAWLFVTLYGMLELCPGGVRHRAGRGAFRALGGMATGYALILYWRSASAAAERCRRRYGCYADLHAGLGARSADSRNTAAVHRRWRTAPCPATHRSASCAAPDWRPSPPAGR